MLNAEMPGYSTYAAFKVEHKQSEWKCQKCVYKYLLSCDNDKLSFFLVSLRTKETCVCVYIGRKRVLKINTIEICIFLG